VADVTHRKIEEIDAIDGFVERVSMYRAASGLGVSAFGHLDRRAQGRRRRPPSATIGATLGETYDSGGTL